MAIRINMHLDNMYYLLHSEKKEIILEVQLIADQTGNPSHVRLPLNVAFVIDRSGSMGEAQKLEYAKQAVLFAINHLTAQDYISVVEYDDVVNVVVPSTPLTNREAVKAAIRHIEPRNMTDLGGGMIEGFAQVAQQLATENVRRVLLLSDGLANAGITDPNQLQQIAAQHHQEKGIALSTFGVGADFNELLMTGLAEHGRGNYYFIDSPDKIPAIFEKELKGLLSVVAQSAKISLTFPPVLSFQKAYGYLYTQHPHQITADLGDVFSGEEKAILFQFNTAQPITEHIHFDLTVAYTDVSNGIQHFSQRLQPTVQITTDATVYGNAQNQTVLKNLAIFAANAELQTAFRQADQNNYHAARSTLAHTRSDLQQLAAQLSEPAPEITAQLASLEAYDNNLIIMESEANENTKKIIQKSSRFESYNISKRKA